MVKAALVAAAHPFRGLVTRGCQHGVLPSSLRQVLPWRWVTEPFTIYGPDWHCEWWPTDFDTVGHRVFWTGLREWEKETSPVMLQHLRHAKCFVDVGANCGIYTVIGCTINPSLKAVAIEPVPKVYAALARNIEKNGLGQRVRTLNLAVSDRDGTVSFAEAEDATMGSMALEGAAGQLIEVPCRTLDSIASEMQIMPDFIKIDVEGFEHLVLSGARQVLGRFRPRIVLEANPGNDTETPTRILSEHGYVFANITHGGLVPSSDIVPKNDGPNWLCTPAEHA
jgi:FkbM family methyltransferase